MSIPFQLKDGRGSNIRQDVRVKDQFTGGVVLTEPVRTFGPAVRPFFNPALGINMNIDTGFSGTPLLIHDGLDAVGFTGSNAVGASFTFNSAAQANSGVQSVLISSPAVGDIGQFLNPGGDLDFSALSYVALSMFIFVDANWAVGDSVSIYGYDTGGGVQVGNKVNLETFFNELNTGVWQSLSIPLTDMGLQNSTVDSFRIQYEVKSGPAPTFYIDDWFLQEGADPVAFSVAPLPGEILDITNVTLQLADNFDMTVINGTAPALPYNAWLGVSARPTGLVFRITTGGEITFQSTSQQMSDLLGTAHVGNVMSDSLNNTHISINFDFERIAPIILDSRNADVMSFIIGDDWSGLDIFRGFALCKIQAIPDG